MAKTAKMRPWTNEDIRMLKTLARAKEKTSVIARKLKRLDEVVSIAIVEPALTDQRGPAARREAAARRDARRGGAGLL